MRGEGGSNQIMVRNRREWNRGGLGEAKNWGGKKTKNKDGGGEQEKICQRGRVSKMRKSSGVTIFIKKSGHVECEYLKGRKGHTLWGEVTNQGTQKATSQSKGA